MKMSDARLTLTLDQLVPLCKDSYEQVYTSNEVPGYRLINDGITKTNDGDLIHPGNSYTLNVLEPIQVNHRNRMKTIIKNCTSDEEMENELAKYLSENMKPPTAENS